MLIDARSLPPETDIETDLCIVGAGPAGLTIAKRLVGRGLRIALLESGGPDFEPEINLLAQGEYTGIEMEPLEATRVRALGGTSTVWEGHCRMLDPLDFTPRPWIPHSGWPFGEKEIAPYYAEAQEIIKLEPAEYDIAPWSARTNSPYLPLDGDIVFHRISLIRPFNFWADYASDLEKSEETSIYTFATVLRIQAAADGQSITHLDVGSPSGNRISFRARRFVVACGGIENARLLLLSNDIHPYGLGNHHDLVGRYFMEHPRFVSGTLLLSGGGFPVRSLYSEIYLHDGLSVRADLGIRPEVQEREKIGNVLGRLRPTGREKLSEGGEAARSIFKDLRRGRMPDQFMHKLWTAISDLDEVAARAYQRLYAARTERSNSFEVHGYLEQVPNPDSRIVLSDKRDAFGQRRAHLIWNLTDLDRRTATRAVELFAQAAGAHDVGRVRVEVASEEVFPPGTDWGHHHMGTTRMDDNPRRGVADRFGKVHGVRNLYVAGSSVFPTSGCATPTLTLVALAARLADHLEKTYTGRKE